jgi:hypothetical protein
MISSATQPHHELDGTQACGCVRTVHIALSQRADCAVDVLLQYRARACKHRIRMPADYFVSMHLERLARSTCCAMRHLLHLGHAAVATQKFAQCALWSYRSGSLQQRCKMCRMLSPRPHLPPLLPP